jgi:predicted ATP-dependent serine protease
VDPNRVELIIAILERYLNLNLSFYDLFINIPGEFKFMDSGLDLAIAAGILSAYKTSLQTKYFCEKFLYLEKSQNPNFTIKEKRKQTHFL